MTVCHYLFVIPEGNLRFARTTTVSKGHGFSRANSLRKHFRALAPEVRFRMPSAAAITVYVKLLDEGTDVMRPTMALPLGDGLYELLPTVNYDPNDESWEFVPGSHVEIKQMNHNGKLIQLVVTNTNTKG